MADYDGDDQDSEGEKPTKRKVSAKRWLTDIEQSQKDYQNYNVRARKLQEIYSRQKYETVETNRKYAMLWANMQVLQPAVYARSPQPAVTRRFTDKDQTGREVAEVLQRSLSSVFDRSSIDHCLRAVRDDFLLVARGTAWVRYVPTFANQEIGDEKVDTLCNETIAFDFVHWSDYITPKVRNYDDMPWIARRVYLDKERFIARFGKKKYEDLSVKQSRKSNDYNKSDKSRICTYEVWSKRDKKVIWLAKDFDEVLDEQDPLYNLHDFWPCPRPAYGTLQTDSLEPIPDYVFYQDQAEEIDDLTRKIAQITESLKLVGFYPAGMEGDVSSAIETALSGNTQQKMIPVAGWSAMVQGGGSKNLIEWVPIDIVVQALKSCIEVRQQLIQDVFQITGISDILRGESAPSETATAQNIKAQWGGLRIRDRQAEMARFARDLTRIAAEIVSEKFQPETIWKLTGLTYQPAAQKQMLQAKAQFAQLQQQQVPPEIRHSLEQPSDEEIIDLIRDDCLRSYRVDIEVDSTIEANEQAEKTARNEFLQNVSQFVQQALPVAQEAPQLIPALGEMLMFVVRGYRAGRQLEDVIQQSVDEMTEKAKLAAENPKPNPKVELEQEKLKAQTQHDQAKLQSDQQHGAARLELEKSQMAAENEREGAKLQADVAHKEALAQIQREGMEHQKGMAERNFALQHATHQADMAQRSQDASMADREFSLKSAAHNKTMVDEATQQALAAESPSGARKETPVETALQALEKVVQTMMEGIATIAAGQQQIAVGQQQLGAEVAKSQNEQVATLQVLAKAITAPKKTVLIRDASGRAQEAETTSLVH